MGYKCCSYNIGNFTIQSDFAPYLLNSNRNDNLPVHHGPEIAAEIKRKKIGIVAIKKKIDIEKIKKEPSENKTQYFVVKRKFKYLN